MIRAGENYNPLQVLPFCLPNFLPVFPIALEGRADIFGVVLGIAAERVLIH